TALLICSACSPHKTSGPAPMAAATEAAPDVVGRRYDLNGDGKPDMVEFGQEVANKEAPSGKEWKVTRREIDINNDGKLDIVRIYDESGKLFEEDFDLDF